MNKSKLTISDFLHQCNLRIMGAMNDETILTSLSGLGYNAERLNAGKILLEEVVVLHQKIVKENAELAHAYDLRNKEREEADSLYIKYFTLAKIAFAHDSAAFVALHLNARTTPSLNGWLSQTKNFYTLLLQNQKWTDSLQAFNVSRQDLEAGLKEVLDVETAASVILKEKGEAQDAVDKRDAKLDELNRWINDFEAVARLALAASPQQLEKLGIVVKR